MLSFSIWIPALIDLVACLEYTYVYMCSQLAYASFPAWIEEQYWGPHTLAIAFPLSIVILLVPGIDKTLWHLDDVNFVKKKCKLTALCSA